MGFLSANWLWIVLIGFMLWMHLHHGGMHGGGHHGHDHHTNENSDSHDHAAATSSEAESTTGHRHGGC